MQEEIAPTSTHQPEIPQNELPQKARLFEHLFPGNSWKSLPKFDLSNIPLLLERLFWSIDSDGTDFGQAAATGQGFARRVDLPHPDQLTLGVELIQAKSSPEKPKPGLISDLLHEEESLGGVGMKSMFWLKPSVLESGLQTFTPVVVKGEDYQEAGEAKVVGVLNGDNRPCALIYYNEGRRSRGTKEKPIKGVGNLQLQPQLIGATI